MLPWSTYKFQTCGWKRFNLLFLAVLRMVSKAALAQLTVAKWKWRMYSIDMFDLSDVWQPTGFLKEIITTRGESKTIWIFYSGCFSGTVIRNISSTSALVDFSNGESCDVPVKFTIPVGGAMPCPHLQVKNYFFIIANMHFIFYLLNRINYRVKKTFKYIYLF